MLGTQELIVIFLIVLVLFGGKKMAGIGKALGTSLREFKEEVNKTDTAVQEKPKDTTQTIDVKATETTTTNEEKTK